RLRRTWLLWRRHSARRGHQAHRRLRDRRDEAPQLRARSAVHAVALGALDGALRRAVRQSHVPGDDGGLVAWEKTIGDILSARGYATVCVGKWHVGAAAGRWPTDHGFDEWYGPPRT